MVADPGPATWAFCVSVSSPGSCVHARLASKCVAQGFATSVMRSRMISAAAVPLVIPQPSKPVAVNSRELRGCSRPTNGMPSAVPISWPDQWYRKSWTP